MKIHHNVTFSIQHPEVLPILREMGYVMQDLYDSIEIDESDTRWLKVHQLMGKYKNNDVAWALFEEGDYSSVSWCKMSAEEVKLEPMPEAEVTGYPSPTYDLTHICSECGIGAKQKSPFLLSSEPKWGKREVIQLKWVGGEIFVRTDIFETKLLPLGLQSMPVLNYSTQQPLATIVQLVIPEDRTVRIDYPQEDSELCSKCGQRKYSWSRLKFFPPMKDIPCGCIARSQQYVGTGWHAWRPCFINIEIYSHLKGLKGIKFEPVEP